MWRSKDLKDSSRKPIEIGNLQEHLKTSCCDIAQTTCLSHGTLVILYTWTLGYLVYLHTWLSCTLAYLAILHTWLFGCLAYLLLDYLAYLHTWYFCYVENNLWMYQLICQCLWFLANVLRIQLYIIIQGLLLSKVY